MAYKRVSDDTGRLVILFSDIFGGGWSDDIASVIKQHLHPERIEEKILKAGWHTSESEILFSLQDNEFRFHFDDDDTISLKQVSGKLNQEELERCANVIDMETQKLKASR